ncbi:Uncharacterized protein FKW44_014331, partial [Caligus rogercresseyi]
MHSNAKLRPDLMSSDVQTVWIELTLPTYSVLVGGVYREWNSSEPGSVLTERDRLDIILDQAKSATGTSKRVLILGDFNLDTLRHNDRSYSRRSFLQILSDGMKDASLDYVTTKATWKSYASIEVSGIPTLNSAEAATAMNEFYISKVEKLREGLPPSQPPSSAWPKSSAPFSFSFAGAGKIAKVIKGMRATEALGVDGIPVSVLKKGIEVLAGPIAHLVNRSLASGTVPTALKMSNVLPVFKGKSAADPASYRPVCILPALSKVLEIIVKSDLEDHLAKTEALPNTQFGFRKGRSTTAALATAHAKWLEAEQRGKVVGVLGFDLSAAFDTVNQLQLLPKLGKLGIAGTQFKWFHSYLTGGYQRVVWNGTESEFLPVEYGVRQGSILGPILYLVLVADVTSCVGIGNEDNSGYADDFFLWAVGDSLEGTPSPDLRGGNGLVLNAAKTQLMIGGNAKKKDVLGFTINVGGVEVHPLDEIEFLG